MRLSALILAGGLVLGTPGIAFAHHDYQGRDRHGGYSYGDGGYDEGGDYSDGGSGRDCRGGGCGNDQRRCQGDQCRGAFSPGPFDRSPVVIYFCPQRNSCNNQGGSNSPPEGEEDGPDGPSTP